MLNVWVEDGLSEDLVNISRCGGATYTNIGLTGRGMMMCRVTEKLRVPCKLIV